jgi:hypothetical protein
MDWLHFCGKSFYTMNGFITEARIHGASRRVALKVLKNMNWGDKIHCAMLDDSRSTLFCHFNVTRIGGLSADTMTLINKRFPCKIYGAEYGGAGTIVDRGCGSYAIGATYFTTTTLPEIARYLEALKEGDIDIGNPMVCGHLVVREKVRLKNIPFRPGFRKVNMATLLEEAKEFNNVVTGQYYVNDVPKPIAIDVAYKSGGELQEFRDYRRGNTRKKGHSRGNASPDNQIVLF